MSYYEYVDNSILIGMFALRVVTGWYKHIYAAKGYAMCCIFVISCYSTKNSYGTALMSSGWCDHKKMKRHKWQPTEDQISHQLPGISVRKNVYCSAARLFLNRGTQQPDRIYHISDALCSAVAMLSVSLVLEGW